MTGLFCKRALLNRQKRAMILMSLLIVAPNIEKRHVGWLRLVGS